jgi:formate C-acetyltransferase
MDSVKFIRTEKLRHWIRNVTPQICPERAVLITESFKTTEGEPMPMRRAKALEHIFANMTIWIHDGELIVGNMASTPRSAPIFPETTTNWVKKELHTFWSRPVDKFFVTDETYAVLMKDVFPYWEGKTIEDMAMRYVPEESKKAWLIDHRIFNPMLYLRNGVGHMIANYHTPVQIGFNGIIKQYDEALEALELSDPDSLEKRVFYESVIRTLKAVIAFARRYSALAADLAKKESDPVRKQELRKISEVCYKVPAEPAQTFWEATQTFWFVQMLIQMETDGTGVSTERYDEIVYPYYQKELDAGTITQDFAQELIECLWIKFWETMKVYDLDNATYFSGYSLGQILTIGGVDRMGRDNTNAITYLCMDAEENINLAQPNLAVRINRNTPDDFLFKVCKHISKGSGKPHLFNDEIIIPALMGEGCSLEDARHYTLIGCVEAGIGGKMNAWANTSMFNLVKCLELALNDGVCALTGKQVGLKTGKAEDMHSYEELVAAYYAQVSYFVKHMIICANAIDIAHQKLLPLPFLSALFDDCAVKGKDVTRGGAKYNFSGPQGVGVADVADSLMAIRQLVFEEGKYNLSEIREAMEKDFAGYTKLYNDIQSIPKYGNDIDAVDEIATTIGRQYCKEVAKYKNARGGKFHAGLYPVSANVPMGMDVGAMPNGRKSRTPLADGVSPSAGADLEGPTAVVKSVAKLDHLKASNGTLLNMKFNPDILKTDEQIEKFMTMIRTFFELGGWHVQFNVVSAETLRKAQKNPEAYRDLLVRVAGYSAFFVDLDHSLQENIIARTEHKEI